MAKTRKNKQADDPAVLREANIQAAHAAIEKKFGKGTVQNLAGNVGMPMFEDGQIPTGSVAMDMALGAFNRREDGSWQTGLPPKRIIEFFGPEGCGKTTLVGQLIANAQRVRPDLRCAMIDMEHSLDQTYYRRLGVDGNRCDFSQPDGGEEALETMEMLLKTGGYSIIALDSIASLLPTREAEGDMGDSHVGLQAKLMSQAMRKLSPELTKPGVLTNLVFTNQTRSKIGPFGGTTTPGGQAMKFYASFRVKMWLGQGHRITHGDDQVGQVTSVQFIKNKVAPPFKQADVPIIFGEGIDNEMTLFDLAKDHGIISQSGAWFSFGDLRLGQGRENCIKLLRERHDLRYAIYDHMFTKALADRGYEPDLTPIPGAYRFEDNSASQVDHFSPVDTSDVLGDAGFKHPSLQAIEAADNDYDDAPDEESAASAA